MRSIKWLLLLALFVSCDIEEPNADDPRVIKAVQQKLDRKKNDHLSKCQEEAIQKAEYAVDSTLRVRALNEKLAVYEPPSKPIKPAKPMIPKLKDTSAIQPLNKQKSNVVKKDSLIIE